MLVVDLGWGGEGPLGKAKWLLAVDVGDLRHKSCLFH